MYSKETLIQPKSSNLALDLKEIWQYRELLETFFWREVRVKYKQTVLGILWVVLQPILTMIIFTILFGRIARIPSGGLPYSLFALIGLTFWNFFSGSLTSASNSLINQAGILKKAYFPRFILPISSVLSNFVDFLINLAFLLVFSLILGHPPSVWFFVILPAALLITMTTAVGIGSFLASINVKFRDVRYALPFFIRILLYLSPVIYSLNIVGPRTKLIMALNPMASVIESVRWTFAGGDFVGPVILAISLTTTILSIIVGVWYFNKTESYFADIV